MSEQEAHYKSLSKDLAKIKKSDVIMRCRDGEVSALSAILEVRSEVFRALFSGEFESEKVIDMSEYSAKVVNDFKNYIYTADISNLTVEYTINEIYELYSLADKYMFEDLLKEALYYLEVAVDYQTLEFIDFALKHMVGTELGDRLIDDAMDVVYSFMTRSNHVPGDFEINKIDEIPDYIKIKIFDYMAKRAKKGGKK
jgi:hypothetical protein